MSHVSGTMFIGRDSQPLNGVDLIDEHTPFEVAHAQSEATVSRLEESLSRALRRFNKRVQQPQQHRRPH